VRRRHEGGGLWLPDRVDGDGVLRMESFVRYYSTMRVGLSATGRDRLWKLGDVPITAS
jgi:hypothetical protein